MQIGHLGSAAFAEALSEAAAQPPPVAPLQPAGSLSQQQQQQQQGSHMDQPSTSQQTPTISGEAAQQAGRITVQVEQLIAKARKGNLGVDSTPSLSAYVKQGTTAVQAARKAFDAVRSFSQNKQHLQQAISSDVDLVTAALALVEEDREADIVRPRLKALLEELQRCKFAPPQGTLLLSMHDGQWGTLATRGAEDDTSFKDYFQLFQKAFLLMVKRQVAAADEAALQRAKGRLDSLDNVELRQPRLTVAGAKKLPPSKQLRADLGEIWKVAHSALVELGEDLLCLP